MRPNQTLCLTDVQRVPTGLFEGDLHAKRVLSLANATLAVVRTASLAVHTIGQGLALARPCIGRPSQLCGGRSGTVRRSRHVPGAHGKVVA